MTRVDALSSIDMPFLLILIPFEEPPHLMADILGGGGGGGKEAV